MFEPENAPNILTDEQEETVHETAMRILEEIGTDVMHEPARKLLAALGTDDLSLAGARLGAGHLERVEPIDPLFPKEAPAAA